MTRCLRMSVVSLSGLCRVAFCCCCVPLAGIRSREARQRESLAESSDRRRFLGRQRHHL